MDQRVRPSSTCKSLGNPQPHREQSVGQSQNQYREPWPNHWDNARTGGNAIGDCLDAAHESTQALKLDKGHTNTIPASKGPSRLPTPLEPRTNLHEAIQQS